MVRKLRMAGYRGQGPIVTFLAMRLIMSFALFAVAAFYIFVVLNPPYPVLAKFSVVVAAALAGYYVPAIYVRNRVSQTTEVDPPRLARCTRSSADLC